MTNLKNLYVLIVCLALSLVGCARMGYLLDKFDPPATVENISYKDDSYNLVSVTTGTATLKVPLKILYFIGGSGCSSLALYMKRYFTGLPPGFLIYGIEKKGVKPGALGLSCTREFWKNYQFNTLISRNKEAFEMVFRRHGSRIWGLVGASEGAPIAAEIAATYPKNYQRLVMIGGGGMKQREELRVLAQNKGELPKLESIYARITANPNDTSARILGMSHKYWSSVLDYDPSFALKKVKQPSLIVIGEKDKSVPVRSAYLANTLLENSLLVEVRGANHTFITDKSNVKTRVMSFIGKFLNTPPPLKLNNSSQKVRYTPE